jgi:hypothetical protein
MQGAGSGWAGLGWLATKKKSWSAPQKSVDAGGFGVEWAANMGGRN